MRLTLVTLLILWAIQNLNAQQKEDFWEQIPDPHDGTIFSLDTCCGNKILVGTDAGLYSTSNWGETWDTLLFCTTVHSIHINEYNHIYLGRGHNIARSKNDGQDWEWLLHSIGTNVISLDSYPGGLMYAPAGNNSSSSFLMRSSAYGDTGTWELAPNFPEEIEYINEIQIKNPDTIYFCVTNFFGGGGVFASYDAGESWEKIGLDEHFVYSLALKENGDIYAGTRGHTFTGAGGFFVLRNGDTAWQQLLEHTKVTSILLVGDSIYLGCSDQGAYGGTRFSPDDGATWFDISSGMGGYTEIAEIKLVQDGHLVAASVFDAQFYKSVEPVINTEGMAVMPKPRISAYPNPCRTELHLRASKLHGEASIGIYNLFGQKIIDIGGATPENSTYAIDVGKLEQGMYLYELETGKGEVFSGKFFKTGNQDKP